MFRIGNWEIKVDYSEETIVLFQNSNKIVAVHNGTIVAIIWEVPAGFPRIESSNVAIVIDEKEHIISLRPKLTLEAIFDYESRYESSSNI